MMKSVDFETREWSRDRGLRLTYVTRDWNDYPFRREDSIKVLSNELGLYDVMSLWTIKLILPILLQE